MSRPAHHHSDMIITPKTKETAHFLRENTEFQLLDPSERIRKAIISKYPTAMPLDPILQLQNLLAAQRCIGKSGNPTRKVVATFQGDIPAQIFLGVWGSFPTETFTPEPLRCYKCHRFGHHSSRCTAKERCGICSKSHPTKQCLDAYKRGETVESKCPNCSLKHHAWNKRCRARLEKLAEMKAIPPPPCEEE